VIQAVIDVGTTATTFSVWSQIAYYWYYWRFLLGNGCLLQIGAFAIFTDY